MVLLTKIKQSLILCTAFTLKKCECQEEFCTFGMVSNLRGSVICFAMQTRKIISSKAIGVKIKFRRQELGISQERLAEVLDVSYQQVQRYESGANRLNVENIQLIAAALSVPVTFFFAAGYEQKVAETPPFYAPASPEEKSLLTNFRRIKEKNYRQLVVNVARLAARKP